MPLGFQSKNGGTIAFGFFNIDTDLLLLEHYFLFAPEFCGYVSALADDKSEGPGEASWDVYAIEKAEDIGDLMGAIHGIHYSGFIGEVYQRFPFPPDPAGFKQKPEGFQNRTVIQEMIESYAKRTRIPFEAVPSKDLIGIGEYLLSREVFHELLQYVWLGGYPGWRDRIRPDYVLEMKNRVEGSQSRLFAGLEWRNS